ncbi:phosphoribosylpyrophosphate synthetase [Antarcticibacterium sp. 1MA-6-2]|uniref:phosphoribosylpyrophosphate synthetase n=1 Tax=Antarcticibacterium sp. 1MA-6-2 TaxID=2908210 RepID=UPI001F41DD36|nr:phosphoribosylpyrophosphate synthetase [Antarcticibacterium sp. 1MA-6-2]UJH92890.1 phosphoribosylpyrophosphate synthetase [Antarcticibacterium sp. 1MA-6-2]
MKLPRNYDTVSEAVNDLQKKGFTTNFSLVAEKQCLVCNHTSLQLSPDEFQIEELYRFEGDTDPGDEMIVMAIYSPKYNIRGVVVNGFGMYADSLTSEITELITKHRTQGHEYN